MSYNETDLLEAINNFKSLDILCLLKQCDEWNISPQEIKENIDFIGYEKIDNINILFYSLYQIRLNQLIKKVEEIEFDFIQDGDQEIFNNLKTKIIEELQEANIYTNCLDSCFNNNLAKRLDETNNFKDEILEIFKEKEENYLNYFFNNL